MRRERLGYGTQFSIKDLLVNGTKSTFSSGFG